MKQIITFNIDRKKLLNANVSYHYHDKGNRAKALRKMANDVGKEEYLKCFEKVYICARIYSPTRRRFDPPNLYPTVKHLIDGLTDCGYWVDDSHKELPLLAFSYGGLSGEKNIFRIDLEIIELIDNKVILEIGEHNE